MSLLFAVVLPCLAGDNNSYLIKDPEVKALYLRATKTWFTKAGLRKADSLLQIGEKRKDPVIKALAAEVRENYMFENGTETEYYKTADELQKAMKKAGLEFQYLKAVYSSIIYDCRYNHTIRALQRAMQLQEDVKKSKDPRALYLLYNSTGIVYDMRGSQALAIEYYSKALEYARKYMTSVDVATVYCNLASMYYTSNEFEKALSASGQVLKYADGDLDMIVTGYSRRCHILYEMKRYDEFMADYAKLEVVSKQYPECYDENDFVWAKALYLILKNRVPEARQLAYSLGTKEDSLDFDITIATRNSNFERAYNLFVKYHDYLQNQQSQLDQKEIIEMGTQLGMAQLQNEKELLKARQQQMLYITVIVVICSVLAFVIIYIIYIYRRRITRQKRKAAQEREIFYRNVTHQLRTPMTVVLGMINQIQTHVANDEKVDAETIDAAKRQSNNLLQLIKQLINASKDQSLSESLLSPDGDLVTSPSANYGTVESHPAVGKKTFAALSASGTSNILVAEDNDDVALLICNLLHDEGYSVTRAVDGQEAWEMLHEDLPDMLLTDIAMPRMDGLELMRHVRADENMNHLPIVVVSARVEDQERLEGISAGAEVYLAKPFINEELLLRVEKLLQQRKLLRERIMDTVAVEPSETGGKPMEAEDVNVGINEDEQAFLNRVNRIIDDNMISGDVTVEFLKDEIGMSLSTLNRKMKNLTSMSGTIYIRTRRMSRAKHLLQTTTKSVSEIETLCGFSTAGYFSRIFKSETGMSPSEYRNQYSSSSHPSLT